MFTLIMTSFCFGKLLKIPENALALQSVFLGNNAELDNILTIALLKLVDIWLFHIT